MHKCTKEDAKIKYQDSIPKMGRRSISFEVDKSGGTLRISHLLICFLFPVKACEQWWARDACVNILKETLENIAQIVAYPRLYSINSPRRSNHLTIVLQHSARFIY